MKVQTTKSARNSLKVAFLSESISNLLYCVFISKMVVWCHSWAESRKTSSIPRYDVWAVRSQSTKLQLKSNMADETRLILKEF